VVLALVCGLFGCFHMEPGHKGRVTDFDTKQPLKDTIVFLDLCRTCFLPINPGGNSCQALRSIETLTDPDGNYHLPSRIFSMPPQMCDVREPRVWYIKMGYFTKISSVECDVALCRMEHYLNYLPIIQGAGPQWNQMKVGFYLHTPTMKNN